MQSLFPRQELKTEGRGIRVSGIFYELQQRVSPFSLFPLSLHAAAQRTGNEKSGKSLRHQEQENRTQRHESDSKFPFSLSPFPSLFTLMNPVSAPLLLITQEKRQQVRQRGEKQQTECERESGRDSSR